jgi:hypothetical protein
MLATKIAGYQPAALLAPQQSPPMPFALPIPRLP